MASSTGDIDELTASLGRCLADFRQAAKLTQWELAANVNFDRTYVSKAESGRCIPNRAFWERADPVLDAEGVLLAAFDEWAAKDAERRESRARGRQTADEGLILPWTAAGSLQAMRVVTDPGAMGPMGRRLFLQLTGTAATAPAHEWLLGNAPTDVARPGKTTALPADVVDHLDTITAQLRRMDDQLGGASLLDLVRGHLRYVVDLIENRHYPDTIGRRLHATAAELLRLAGLSCFDANRHAVAQRYWIAALHTAHAAGDRAMGANILGFMSHQAVELGQARESVTLAQTARAGYRGANPKVTAILDLWTAGAHALDGAVTDSRRALDAMFDRIGDTPPSSGEPGWSYWLDEAQAHAFAGVCYLRLQDWQRARGHLNNALRTEGTKFPRDGAKRRISLATTYLYQDRPDLDQALALGTEAIDALSGTVNSAHCMKRLAPLIDGLAPFRRRHRP